MATSPPRQSFSLILYADAGRGSASGAVVSHTAGMPPAILAVATGEDTRGMETATALAERTVAAIQKITSELTTALPKTNALRAARFETSLCLLASPFYTTETTTVEYHGERVQITEELVRKLVASHRHTQPELKKMRLTSSKIINISVNGYPTGTPYGKYATDVALTIYESGVDEDITRRLRAAIVATINIEPAFEPFSFAAFTVLRELCDAPDSFLLVSTGNKVTELARIRAGIIEHTVSFPLGTDILHEAIARSAKTTPASGASLLALSRRGHLSESVTPVVPGEWQQEFGKALTLLEEHGAVPHTVYCVGDGDARILFHSLVGNLQQAPSVLPPGSLTTILDGDDVGQLLAQVGPRASVFLSVGGLYQDLLSHSTKIHSRK